MQRLSCTSRTQTSNSLGRISCFRLGASWKGSSHRRRRRWSTPTLIESVARLACRPSRTRCTWVRRATRVSVTVTGRASRTTLRQTITTRITCTTAVSLRRRITPTTGRAFSSQMRVLGLPGNFWRMISRSRRQTHRLLRPHRHLASPLPPKP